MLLCEKEINDQKYNPCIQLETIHFRLTTAITKIEKNDICRNSGKIQIEF